MVAKQKAASWQWQAWLIVLPVIVLAVMGWLGLVEMQKNVIDQARSSAQTLCQQRAKEIHAGLIVLIGKHPVPGKFDDPPIPAPEDEAMTVEQLEDFYLGRSQNRRKHNVSRSRELTPAGLPTQLLYDFKRWQSLSDEQKASGDDTRDLIKQALLDSPSVITPHILDQVDPTNQTGWRETWRHVVRAQRYLREAATTSYTEPNLVFREGPFPDPSMADRYRSGMWLLGNPLGFGDSSRRGMVPPDALGEFCQRSFQERNPASSTSTSQPASSWPAVFNAMENRWSEPTDLPWCELRIYLGSDARPPAIGSTSAGAEVLASYGAVPNVIALLRSPELLLDQQILFTRWFVAILGLSVLSAMIGLLMLRRTILRERALGEMKTNFMASVTHELRAPVASLQLLAEGLQAGHVSSESKRRDYFHLMVEECRRLGALIANVLDLSRIERGSREFLFEEADLPSLVRDTVKLHVPRAESLGIHLECDVAELDPPAIIDTLAMQQALSNLLDNALKFAPRGSTIDICLESLDTHAWRLSVADKGPGVPLEERIRIFEAFHRVGSELRRETQGVGIGLAIVRHVVDAHHGRVWVESEPNKSTRFIIEGPPPHSPS